MFWKKNWWYANLLHIYYTKSERELGSFARDHYNMKTSHYSMNTRQSRSKEKKTTTPSKKVINEDVDKWERSVQTRSNLLWIAVACNPCSLGVYGVRCEYVLSVHVHVQYRLWLSEGHHTLGNVIAGNSCMQQCCLMHDAWYDVSGNLSQQLPATCNSVSYTRQHCSLHN